MSNLEDLLKTLQTGTREEKGNTITELARLKDPRALDALKKIADSDDAELSIMAFYTLGAMGSMDINEVLKALHLEGDPFIAKLKDELSEAQRLLDASYLKESKEKFLELLQLYRTSNFSIGIAHFDRLMDQSSQRTIGLILGNLGRIEIQMGNLDEGVNYSYEAIDIGSEIGDGQILSTSYGNIGLAFAEMDKYYQALEFFHKSLEIMDQSIDPWIKKNRMLYNLSILYHRIWNFDKALEYAEEALTVAREEKDTIGIGWALNAAAINFVKLGDEIKAKEFFMEALKQCRENGDRQTEGIILMNLGFIYLIQREYQSSEEVLFKALEIFKATGNKYAESTALTDLSQLSLDQQDIEKARDYAEQALRRARETDSKTDDADACYILGTIYDCYDYDPERAYEYYREAIELYETIRKDLGIDEFKISYADNISSAYAQMVRLCLELGDAGEAFQYVERSKSRSLVELLSKAVDDITPHSISNEKMKEVQQLRDHLVSLKKRLRYLYQDIAYSATEGEEISPDEGERTAIFSNIIDVENRYRAVYEEVKVRDPEFASFSMVEPLDIEKVKESLDPDTRLVEFYQTTNRLFIFVLSKESNILTFELEIEADQEWNKLSELLQKMGGDLLIDTNSHQYLKEIKLPLSHFYKLLFAPVEDVLKGAKRLIIIPHLFWHYLPFHALYNMEDKEYLIDRYEISYAPSAEVLKYCRMKNNHDRKSAIIFANPTGDLPFTEEEAHKVSKCFGEDGKIYIRKEATLRRLESIEDADILHLACHGLFRDDEPIFSHLLLADTEDSDGACLLPDIFNLRLRTTLVTMSACESGLSRPSTGDELIGFSRGFFYAGAPSIIATLWRVNDRSTALFMEDFYKNLIQKNSSKSQALQTAIRTLKSKEEYQHPYFWAPFVLMGDWV